MPGDNRYGWQGAGRTDPNPATEQSYAPATRMIGPVRAITPLPSAPIFIGPVSIGADTGCTNAIFRVSGNMNITQRIGVGVCATSTLPGLSIAGDCSPDTTLTGSRTLGTASLYWDGAFTAGVTTPNASLDNGSAILKLDGVDAAQTSGQVALFENGGDMHADMRGQFVIHSRNTATAGSSFTVQQGNPSATIFQITNTGVAALVGTAFSFAVGVNPPTNVLDIRSGSTTGGWGTYALIGTSPNQADAGGLLLGNSFTSSASNTHWKIASTFNASPSFRFRMGWVTTAATETWLGNAATFEVGPLGTIGIYTISSGVNIGNQLSIANSGLITAASQRALDTTNFIGSVNAVSEVVGGRFGVQTAAAAFTAALVAGVRIINAVIGAGSTATTQYGILIDDQTGGTSNFGIRISQGNTVTPLFVSQSSGNPTQPVILVGNGTVTAAATTINGTFYQFNQTWNGTGVYKAMYHSIVNTASGAGSTFLTYTNTVQNILVIGVNGDTKLTPVTTSGFVALTVVGVNSADAFDLTQGTNGTGFALTQVSGSGTAISVSGGTVTGANTFSILSLAQTWNTTGAPHAIDVQIADTAVGANALIFNLQTQNKGIVFQVAANGNINALPSGATSAVFSCYAIATQANNGFCVSATPQAAGVGGVQVVQAIGGTGSDAYTVNGGTQTGANAFSLFNGSQTWNTTGNPAALKVNITNTASGATAKLLQLQIGGSDIFSVNVTGQTIITASATAGTTLTLLQSTGGTGLTITQVSGVAFPAIFLSGGTQTGATATSLLNLSQTWNTTGNPAGIIVNITNTASGATARLFDLQVASTSFVNVGMTGIIKNTQTLVNAIDLSTGPGNIAFGSKNFLISAAGTTTPVGNAKYTILDFTVAVTQTIAAPSPSPKAGTTMIFEIFGNTVAPGVITWNGVYHFAGGVAPTNPASGKRRYVAFICIDGTNLNELYRSTGDI